LREIRAVSAYLVETDLCESKYIIKPIISSNTAAGYSALKKLSPYYQRQSYGVLRGYTGGRFVIYSRLEIDSRPENKKPAGLAAGYKIIQEE
jgi:hypothetical protein